MDSGIRRVDANESEPVFPVKGAEATLVRLNEAGENDDTVGSSEVRNDPASEGSDGLPCEAPLVEKIAPESVQYELFVVEPEETPEPEVTMTDDNVPPDARLETSPSTLKDVRLSRSELIIWADTYLKGMIGTAFLRLGLFDDASIAS